MDVKKLDDQAIFEVARKIGSPEARQAYLAQICGEDLAAVERIEALSACARRKRELSWNRPLRRAIGIHRRSTSHLSEKPRHADRPVQAAAADRRRRHGHGLHGRADPARPAQGRPQGHQAGHGQPAGHRPLRGRAAGPGDDGPCQHRPRPRRRDHGSRPAVLRHGAGPRRADHQVLRRQPPDAARAAGAVRAGLPGDPARPPEGDHPPRHQAVQRDGHALRRQAGAQGDRLRRGQGDRAEADRADPVHAVRHHGRHAGIHEPGAGGDERPGRRYPQRHLLAGRAAVRAADGQHAAEPQAGQGGSVCRDSPHDQGGGAAQAEHAAERLGRGAGVDLGPAPHGAGQADEAGARRAGLDRDEDAWRRTATAATRRPTASPRTCSATWTTSRCRRARRRRGIASASSPGGTSGPWPWSRWWPRRCSP